MQLSVFKIILVGSVYLSLGLIVPKWVRLSRSSTFTGLAVTSLSNSFIEAEGSGSPCRIKVIGVGGGGGNAVNRMLESSTGVLGVELWTVNTDAQALSRSLAPKKLNIGALTSRLVIFKVCD
jgi:hypothetical protein